MDGAARTGGAGGTTGTGGGGGSGGGGTNATGGTGEGKLDSGEDVAQPTPDSASDGIVPTACAGKADFTACSVVTTPDRHYDICVSGVCVSPGCGDSTCNVPGPHFPLADTGQRACYDNASQLTCPAAGQSFYGQDAQYGWDTLHVASDRYSQDHSSSGQPLILDKVTGLVWKACSAGLTGDTCATGSAVTYTWQAAVAYCDGLAWGGYLDWHLPDPHELNSIAGTGWWTVSTTTDGGGVQSPGSDFWSSSSFAGDANLAWSGSASLYGFGRFNKTLSRNVLCVRGGTTTPSARFARDTSTNAQPVVADSATGLAWQGCLAGLTGDGCTTGAPLVRTWEDALAYCEGLSWAGNADWRLPNVKELLSIANLRQYDPAIDINAFPSMPAGALDASTTAKQDWSSSSSYDQAYAIDLLFDGAHSYATKAAGSNHIRCVRGGL